MTTINLQDAAGGGEVHNLSGKERGLSFRNQIKLDALDEAEDEIVFVIPESIFLITDSFVLGMLSKSAKKLGSMDAFWKKYRFHGDEGTVRQIFRALERATEPRTKLL